MLYNSGVRVGKKNQFYFRPGTWPNELPSRVSSVTYFSEKNMLCVYYRKTGKIAVVATPHAFLPRTSRI
jgi:hypothetical protein